MRVRPIRVGARFSQHIEHGRVTAVMEHRPPQRRVPLLVHGIHDCTASQQLDGNVSPSSLRGEMQRSSPSQVTSTYVRPGVDRSPNRGQITRPCGVVQR